MERFENACPGGNIDNQRGICMRAWHVFRAGEHREWAMLVADEIAASVGSGDSVSELLPPRSDLFARPEGEFGSENADFRLHFIGDFTT